LIIKVKNKSDKSNELTHIKVIKKIVFAHFVACKFKGRTYKYL